MSRPSPPCRANGSPAPARGASIISPTATGRRPMPIRAGSITTCWWRSTRAPASTSASPSLWAHHFDRLDVKPGDRVLAGRHGLGLLHRDPRRTGWPGRQGPEASRSTRRWRRPHRRNLAARPQARVQLVEGDASRIEGQWDVVVAFAGASAPPRAAGSTRWPTVAAPASADDRGRRAAAASCCALDRRGGRSGRALGRTGRLLSLRRRPRRRRRRGGAARGALSDPAGQTGRSQSLRRDPHDHEGRPAGCMADGWCLCKRALH